eukprot:TRINITY_DN914_c0_g1_i4.p1 TRINITY_DN914_c0_g1~~TRINITY_DN914_c0_g1_i4.p1  ORF type:complete len:528 (-),score=91.42 TRINITY_DN914_c0_g1_i4:110-1693(-)
MILNYAFSALSDNSSRINSNYKELITAIWDFDWRQANDISINSYIELILNLNFSHGTSYIVQTFDKLVSNLLPRKDPEHPSGYDTEVVLRYSPKIHQCIHHLLNGIPSSASKMILVLTEYYPHKSFPMPVQKCYLENLLLILDYCVILEERLWEVILDRIIEIDVEIRLEDLPDEDELFLENDDEFGLFVMDDEQELANNNDIEIAYKNNANKLDAMLGLMIQYLEAVPEGERRDNVFKNMLKAFDSLLLHTHKSKFTQFLIFFICKQNRDYATYFLKYLFNKLEVEVESPIIQRTCAAYIGSFAGRAAYIDISHLKEAIHSLFTWIHRYLDKNEGSYPDAERHAVFYSVCQAALYVICFKQDLLSNNFDHGFMKNLRIQRVLESSLNPLILILSTVVQEFHQFTQNLSYINCGQILERNKNIVLPTKSSYGGSNHLDTFFPFDPYLLKHSSQYFKGYYTYWKSENDIESSEDDDFTPDHDSVQGKPSFQIDLSSSWERAQFMVEDNEEMNMSISPLPMSGYMNSFY